MADLTDTVGEKAANKNHDVALVQAILGLVKRPKAQAYLSGFYDGLCGGKTKTAIAAFQADYQTIIVKAVGVSQPGGRAADSDCVVRPGQFRSPFTPTAPSTLDDAGVMKPGGATILKMNALLAPDFRDIMIAPGTRLVYWPDLPTQVAATAQAIQDDGTLHKEFRANVATLVRRMFEKHKILLTIAPSGGRRTFQEQYDIATTPDADGGYATGAGPGESNHNWGQAVDIGFNQFEWLQSGGNSVIDDWWLNKLTKVHPGRNMDLWKIRNVVAFDELHMFPSKKPGDHIHIQRYGDDNVSMVKSLAALLEKKGKLSWQWNHGYECDLGFAGTWHKVGTSIQIWDKTGPMEKHWIAAGKGVPVASIKDSDVKQMRDALRADFEIAEAARNDWEAVGK
jgi:hypothetical protein